MSKNNKKLLEENTIRRFMTLAKLEPLSNPFVDRLNEACKMEEEEKEVVEEDLSNLPMEEEKEEEIEIEDGPEIGGEEEVPPELEAEPEMGGEGGDKEGIVANLVNAIADAIQQATGVEVEVEGGEGGEGAIEDIGGEELPPEASEVPPPPSDEEVPEEEIMETKEIVAKSPQKIKGQKDAKLAPAKKVSDSMVNEVCKRVISRLTQKKSK